MSNVPKNQPRNRRHAKGPGANRRVPSLRFHKASGLAYVVLSGKTIYCGKPGVPATEQRYHQAVAEWLAAGRQLPVEPGVLTVKELLARFWTYAEQHYRTLTDGRNKELEQFRLALRPVKELYSETPAVEFGPLALKAVRQKMVRKGWCRPYINKQINRIRLMFKWAVSDELVAGSVLYALQAVPGLRRGHGDALEPAAVKPVPGNRIEAVQPFVSRQVWAMVQLQLLTGARPGEITQMRPCDIERGEDVWVYRPPRHKTAHHGFERKVFVGPRAQQVLGPFLLRDRHTYCFSSAEAENDRRRRLHEERTTPLSCGNVPGSNRKDDPKWSAGDRYTTDSYHRAIARACDRAFPPRQPLAARNDETAAEWRARLTQRERGEIAAWQKTHRWHPHQLRHNAATELRKEFGIEAARIVLGHRSAAVTEVYAERDERQAVEAMMRVG
jgi:integrase